MRFVAFLAAIVVCALTRDAVAQEPRAALPPIALDRCVVKTNWSYLRPNQRWVTTAGLNIVFHNRATQTIKEVDFEVDYRGDVETINDVGSFAAGVPINHSYAQFVDFAYLGTRPNFCRVMTVRFADGTTWKAPVTRRQAL